MDITWVSDPPKVAILAALVIPTYGGDTMWTDLYGAWDRLSPTMKEMLAPLQVLHTPGETFWGALHRVGTFDVAELRRAFPGAVHPLVRDHPVTGRTVLNLSGYFMESIVGMHPDESSWLLAWLGRRGWRTRTCKFAGGGGKVTSPSGTNTARIIGRCPITTRSTAECAGAPWTASTRTCPLRSAE